ncbi:GPO family capsid scaffolding protein [Arsenophonus apicola]|uniref:GPO family capsid scaffolding protein n=1 Tax=Arsenophonus apicola TaxID=2879119 RepID=A0ABY8P5A4_9GAMM|nr:GPO family capsid scaffolding protein [Arsenophonus apicola]WGO84683.1 GPO family capsid scaffolding protein [Arsenophonus apicola]
MAKKSKPVRICVEGATTDGRTVQRHWLTEIEKNYDPNVYGARINLEHLNYEWMPRFGDVESVYTEEIKTGALKGKLALYAKLSPTDELIKMNQKRQKVYTSVEISPKFSDTEQAYLVGLAVTDNPASLGNEMLQFSHNSSASPLSERKQAKDNVFTSVEETLIEFVEEKSTELTAPSLFTRVVEMLSGKNKKDNARFADIDLSVELCAKTIDSLQIELNELKTQLSQYHTDQQALTTLRTELNELKQKLSKTDGNPKQRPQSQGNSAMTAMEYLTDC